MRNGQVFGLMLCLAMAGSAHAQTFVQRSSRINYTFTYGHGGDVTIHQDDDITWSDLDAVSQHSVEYNQSISGSYLSDSYTAGVNMNLINQYSIDGDLDSFRQIDASTTSNIICTAAGAPGVGSSGLSTVPGNELYLYFDVANPFQYEFRGSTSYNSNGAAPHGRAEIQRWTGSMWVAVYSSLTSNGVLHTSTAVAGNYRIYVWSEVHSRVNDEVYGNSSVYFRNLDAVPEPTSIAGLAMGLVAVGRRFRSRGKKSS